MNEDVEQASLWQQSLAMSEDAVGFYEKLPNSSIVYYAPPNASRLMVSFDGFNQVKNGDVNRDPWGFKFALESGWAFLGIMPYKKFWYRDEILFDKLEEIAERGLFKRYEKVLFTGSSMGGFAACAFAKLSPGANVLAFAPQNTLDPRLQNYDRRYKEALKQDWGTRYLRANDGIKDAKNVYILYDPLQKEDKIHTSHIEGANVLKCPVIGCDHAVVYVIHEIGLLKFTSMAAMEGKINFHNFRNITKHRRAARFVRINCTEYLNNKGNTQLAQRYSKALVKYKKKYLEKYESLAGLDIQL